MSEQTAPYFTAEIQRDGATLLVPFADPTGRYALRITPAFEGGLYITPLELFPGLNGAARYCRMTAEDDQAGPYEEDQVSFVGTLVSVMTARGPFSSGFTVELGSAFDSVAAAFARAWRLAGAVEAVRYAVDDALAQQLSVEGAPLTSGHFVHLFGPAVEAVAGVAIDHASPSDAIATAFAGYGTGADAGTAFLPFVEALRTALGSLSAGG